MLAHLQRSLPTRFSRLTTAQCGVFLAFVPVARLRDLLGADCLGADVFWEERFRVVTSNNRRQLARVDPLCRDMCGLVIADNSDKALSGLCLVLHERVGWLAWALTSVCLSFFADPALLECHNGMRGVCQLLVACADDLRMLRYLHSLIGALLFGFAVCGQQVDAELVRLTHLRSTLRDFDWRSLEATPLSWWVNEGDSAIVGFSAVAGGLFAGRDLTIEPCAVLSALIDKRCGRDSGNIMGVEPCTLLDMLLLNVELGRVGVAVNAHTDDYNEATKRVLMAAVELCADQKFVCLAMHAKIAHCERTAPLVRAMCLRFNAARVVAHMRRWFVFYEDSPRDVAFLSRFDTTYRPLGSI
jgi:hypothetical protein